MPSKNWKQYYYANRERILAARRKRWPKAKQACLAWRKANLEKYREIHRKANRKYHAKESVKLKRKLIDRSEYYKEYYQRVRKKRNLARKSARKSDDELDAIALRDPVIAAGRQGKKGLKPYQGGKL